MHAAPKLRLAGQAAVAPLAANPLDAKLLAALAQLAREALPLYVTLAAHADEAGHAAGSVAKWQAVLARSRRAIQADLAALVELHALNVGRGGTSPLLCVLTPAAALACMAPRLAGTLHAAELPARAAGQLAASMGLFGHPNTAGEDPPAHSGALSPRIYDLNTRTGADSAVYCAPAQNQAQHGALTPQSDPNKLAGASSRANSGGLAHPGAPQAGGAAHSGAPLALINNSKLNSNFLLGNENPQTSSTDAGPLGMVQFIAPASPAGWTKDQTDWLPAFLAESEVMAEHATAGAFTPAELERIGRPIVLNAALYALAGDASSTPSRGGIAQAIREQRTPAGCGSLRSAFDAGEPHAAFFELALDLAAAADWLAGPKLPPTEARMRHVEPGVRALTAAGINGPAYTRLLWLFPGEYIAFTVSKFRAQHRKPLPGVLIGELRTNRYGWKLGAVQAATWASRNKQATGGTLAAAKLADARAAMLERTARRNEYETAVGVFVSIPPAVLQAAVDESMAQLHAQNPIMHRTLSRSHAETKDLVALAANSQLRELVRRNLDARSSGELRVIPESEQP